VAAAHVLERVYILVYKPLHLITGILPFAAQGHIGSTTVLFMHFCRKIGNEISRFMASYFIK
jgi:hypothetical protein